MQTIHQHPRDLALALFRGEPTIPITCLKSAHLSIGRWDAAFHIIGESHAVTLAYDSEPIFAEMLSCAPLSAPCCNFFCDLSDMQPRQINRDGYSVHVTFDDPPSAAPDAAAAIEFAFPRVFGQKPITRIQWAYHQNTIQWWTLHVYPLSTGVTHVYTASFYDITGRV